MARQNKYSYARVIQQSTGQGWEDVSEYECNSQGKVSEMSGVFRDTKRGRRELTLFAHDLAEYQFTGYPTRSIFRRSPITQA